MQTIGLNVRSVRNTACIVAAFIFGIIFAACSTPDPADLARLETAIEKQDKATQDKMKVGVIVVRVRREDPKKSALRVFCRTETLNGWTGWEHLIDSDGLISDIQWCMLARLGNYEQCGQETADTLIKIAKDAFAKADLNAECRWEWENDYNPKFVTIDEEAHWLVGSPEPPPGFLPEELAPLLPFICPLADWGCPPRPNDPAPGDGK